MFEREIETIECVGESKGVPFLGCKCLWGGRVYSVCVTSQCLTVIYCKNVSQENHPSLSLFNKTLGQKSSRF